MDTKPWWQSTTANGVLSAAIGLLSIVVPMLLPKLTTTDVSGTVQAVWAAVGAVLNAGGLIIAIWGRVHTDGKQLTMTRR